MCVHIVFITELVTANIFNALCIRYVLYVFQGNPRCPVLHILSLLGEDLNTWKTLSRILKKACNSTNQWEGIRLATLGRSCARKWEFKEEKLITEQGRRQLVPKYIQLVSPTKIQQLSGHKNVNSIINFSTASNEHQRHMSSILTHYSWKSSEPPVSKGDCSSPSFETWSSALSSTSVVPSLNTDDIIHQTLTQIIPFENQPIMKEHIFVNFRGGGL